MKKFITDQVKIFSGLPKKLRWVTNKLKSSSVRATNVSTFDVPTLFTTLPHYVIKEKLIYIIEKKRKNHREGSLYLHVMTGMLSEWNKRYTLWSCQKVCEVLIFLLNNVYIIYYYYYLYLALLRWVGITMGTNCAPLVADLFLFC